jgi:hypothetical protein
MTCELRDWPDRVFQAQHRAVCAVLCCMRWRLLTAADDSWQVYTASCALT